MDKQEAVKYMNSLGRGRIPFLFVIDFEMKAIRFFLLDQKLPPTVLFDFPSIGNIGSRQKKKACFTFRKYPVSFAKYNNAFKAIQKHIQHGNTFLVNLTFPTRIETSLTLREIFFQATAKYRILVDDAFVCFSPETFVTITGDTIFTYPMKGTVDASVHEPEKKILSDEKETAEHSTIVDLLRNDLSMIATSVKVNRFRYIDRIHTHEGELLQVSSEISGKLPRGFRLKLGEIFFALLPAGSITGAPKEKTVAIIREAEKTDRGYYTGVCGIFDGNNLDSAVMIRFIEMKNETMFFRSGGGITFLSNARAEYKELKDKVYVPIA
ncbi:MAG: aminodeoxychorismate synthase component I [Bacteroidales bacterium]|nr:aminodeoxychorismate synthase component I [Bacteroidales bacterium]